jgi:hypothetical protein
MLEMNNFQHGKIYKINVGDNFYIGSTTLPLSLRHALHRSCQGRFSSPLYLKMREGESTIELLEAYPCNSSSELRQREHVFIHESMTNPLCLNKRAGFQSRQERLEYLKQYCNTKVQCACGMTVCRGNMTRHRASVRHAKLLNQPALPTVVVETLENIVH